MWFLFCKHPTFGIIFQELSRQTNNGSNNEIPHIYTHTHAQKVREREEKIRKIIPENYCKQRQNSLHVNRSLIITSHIYLICLECVS